MVKLFKILSFSIISTILFSLLLAGCDAETTSGGTDPMLKVINNTIDRYITEVYIKKNIDVNDVNTWGRNYVEAKGYDAIYPFGENLYFDLGSGNYDILIWFCNNSGANWSYVYRINEEFDMGEINTLIVSGSAGSYTYSYFYNNI